MHGIQVLIFLHVVRWGMTVGMAGRAVLIAGGTDVGRAAKMANKQKMEVKVQVQKYKTPRKFKIKIFVGPRK